MTTTEVPFSIIHVFSNAITHALGNPAAVLLLDEDLPADKLQEIAQGLQQPATTFLWKTKDPNKFNIKWFAPDAEIDLCGHGAMAASVFLANHFPQQALNGFELEREGMKIYCGLAEEGRHFIELEHIKRQANTPPPKGLEKALGQKILEYYPTNNKDIVVFESEQNVAQMKPDFDALRKIDVFGYAVCALSAQADDFVCRTLVPHVQQLEDHATGSTQAILVSFWADRLQKSTLISRQLSRRGGYFKAIAKDKSFILNANSYYTVNGTFFLH